MNRIQVLDQKTIDHSQNQRNHQTYQNRCRNRDAGFQHHRDKRSYQSRHRAYRQVDTCQKNGKKLTKRKKNIYRTLKTDLLDIIQRHKIFGRSNG